jgi:hypothetical protein
MIEYCADCGKMINGFNYGYGVNNQCSICHNREVMNNAILECLDKVSNYLQPKPKKLNRKFKNAMVGENKPEIIKLKK